MAVRDIVKLFKLVNREEELHRKVLAFFISHDDKSVRIYGHYALIKERAATFYRHPIRTFDFTEQNGREKWTAYQFTKSVYFEFMSKLHELICSAIDQISLNQASQGASLPPQIPLNNLFDSTDLESEQPNSQEMTASAPASQDTAGSKRKRLTGNAVLQRQLDQRDEQIERLMQEMKEQRQESKEQRQESKEQLEQQRQQISKLTEALMQPLPAQPKLTGKK